MGMAPLPPVVKELHSLNFVEVTKAASFGFDSCAQPGPSGLLRMVQHTSDRPEHCLGMK